MSSGGVTPPKLPDRVQLPNSVEWILAVWIVVVVIAGGLFVYSGIKELRKFGIIGIVLGAVVMVVGIAIIAGARSFIRGRRASPGAQIAMAILGPPALLGLVLVLCALLFGFAALQEAVFG